MVAMALRDRERDGTDSVQPCSDEELRTGHFDAAEIDCICLSAHAISLYGGKALETDSQYFARRAREERVAGAEAKPEARNAHFQLAELYERAAVLLAAAEDLEIDLNLSALRPEPSTVPTENQRRLRHPCMRKR
jgi:capsular polysaccharide biosynthesis protein